MYDRIKKVKASLEENKIDAYLVTKPINIKYLTGFPSEDSWLFITQKKVFYITDFRYVLEAKKGLSGAKIVKYEKSLPVTLFDICREHSIKCVGFDERHFSHFHFKLLKKACPSSVKLKGVNGFIESFREIKEFEEIQHIRKALSIHKEALRYLKRVIKPGVTELSVLHKLEDFVKAKGVGFSFPSIIASGPNSCYPHAKVTDRKIKNNEPVLVDMGIDYKGYKSDLTRMFFLSKISELVEKVNDTVKTAQQKAIESIKPGMKAAQVDYQARNYLKQKKLAKYFGHALGHGVGLEVHEGPRLAQNNNDVLKAGMIITIEPAVYLPDQFGIRIEDMVLVKESGFEVLSADID